MITSICRLMGMRWGSVALTAAFMLAGCSGEAPPAAGAAGMTTHTDSDICFWMSADDIEGVIGARPADAKPAAGLPGCAWMGADGLPLLQVTLAPNAASSPDEYAARLSAELGEAWSEGELKPVAGLGDFAFYTPDARMLQVFRGRRILQIMVSRPSGEVEARVFAHALLARDW